MPEYLAPGIYVVEVEGGGKSIPGVPTGVDDQELRAIAALVRERFERRRPGWTDSNNKDPGITLLEVLAYVAEMLAYRTGTVPKGSKLHAERLAAAALTLLGGIDKPRGGVLSFSKRLCGWRARLVRWIAR